MEEERERAQKEYEAQLEAQRVKEAAEKEEERKRQEKEERDRLDAMVSSRLNTSDGVALVAEKHEPVAAPAAKSKYDLGNWKYADLRDAINTSNDVEMLKACKEEFHRRLRIYNEWKSRNTANRDQPPARAPLSVYNESSAAPSAPPSKQPQHQQRFFKVSFMEGKKKGK